MMQDHSKIATGVVRSVRAHAARNAADPWPKVHFVEHAVEHSADYTRLSMLDPSVRLIIVLGGDGTHRVVASKCGDIPLVTLSSGTNNAFPECCEATTAGIAAGLCASGRLELAKVCRQTAGTTD